MTSLSPALAYVPRDEQDAALVRRVIEMTVARWRGDGADVALTALVREYLGDGLFALEVTRTDSRQFDLRTIVDNGEWQQVDTGAAWVQVDEDGALAVGYEMDHGPLDGAQDADYAPVYMSGRDAAHLPVEDGADLVSVTALAAEYGVPYQTAVSARRRGDLAARRIGRNFATTRAAFCRWLESR